MLDRPAGAGQGKVVVLTVDLDKSDLPLQTAFPIMMSQPAQLVRRNQGRAARGARRRRGRRGRASRRRRRTVLEHVLIAPDGREQPIDRAGGRGQGDRRPARPVRSLERAHAIVQSAPSQRRTPKLRSTSRDVSRRAGLQPGRSARERPAARRGPARTAAPAWPRASPSGRSGIICWPRL